MAKDVWFDRLAELLASAGLNKYAAPLRHKHDGRHLSSVWTIRRRRRQLAVLERLARRNAQRFPIRLVVCDDDRNGYLSQGRRWRARTGRSDARRRGADGSDQTGWISSLLVSAAAFDRLRECRFRRSTCSNPGDTSGPECGGGCSRTNSQSDGQSEVQWHS